MPTVFESPSKATSNKSVDDIMAPVSGSSAKPNTNAAEQKMPIIE
jgi:hypothetical protein